MNCRNSLAATLLVWLILGCAENSGPDAVNESGGDRPEIDAVFAAWDRPGSPGCALAVSQVGEQVYARGYGYANLDYDNPVTPQTVFDVGSLNKQFVAAGILMLAEEGKLFIEDDIRKWLPELPAYEQSITLEHMLYHTSGLRDYLNLFPLAGRGHYYPISHPQILAMMARQRALIFPPGERYLYSNTAYMLLAQVIERASAQSLGEFAERRIFEPLEMTGSLMYDDYEEIIPRRATGYDRDDDAAGGNTVRMVHNFNFDVPGDGQLYTTVEDLLRWDDWLHGPNKPALRDELMIEGTLNNGEPTGHGKGLFLDEYRGQRIVYHTGSSWGSRAALMRFVDPGLAIAIACNDGNADTKSLAFAVADRLLADVLAPRPADDPEPDAPQEDGDKAASSSLSSEQLSAFVGDYFSEELDAFYRIALENGHLVVRIEQEPALDLHPVGDGQFEIRFGDQAYWDPPFARLTFKRRPGETTAGFDLSSGTERGLAFEKWE